MIVINFKNYKSGNQSLFLAKTIQKYLPKAILAVPATDIQNLTKNTNMQIYAQHISPLKGNKNTGFILPESIKDAGAKGTLLNHSEHKTFLSEIKKTILRNNKLNLKTIVCASSIRITKKIKKLSPYAIAFEDPKLIASKKSITSHNPKTIKKFVKLLENTSIIPLCGSGINSITDIQQAKKLGCKGILIASAIANSKNPIKLLKQFK
jgi:triosephosphate isomerase (TIM)